MGSWMNSKLPLASEMTVREWPVPVLNATTVTSRHHRAAAVRNCSMNAGIQIVGSRRSDSGESDEKDEDNAKR